MKIYSDLGDLNTSTIVLVIKLERIRVQIHHLWMSGTLRTRCLILVKKEPIPAPVNLADQFNQCVKIKISYRTTWKERTRVLDKLYGNYETSYKLVPCFCEMVKRRYESSVAGFLYGTTDGTFLSMTISFIPVIEGWRFSFKFVISLDACPMIGKFGGVLLDAIRLDAWNCLVPLGIMVCRHETIENWNIFLGDIKHMLNTHPYSYLTNKREFGKLLAIISHLRSIYIASDTCTRSSRNISKALAFTMISGMLQNATRHFDISSILILLFHIQCT